MISTHEVQLDNVEFSFLKSELMFDTNEKQF